MSYYSSPSCQRAWIAIFLLLILLELSASLLLFAGEFIYSDKVVVSPFRVCFAQETSGSLEHSDCRLQNASCLKTAVISCLYAPLVLVAFALLAVVFREDDDDAVLLRFGVLCQGLSGVLLLSGMAGFLQMSRAFLSLEGLSCWFYACLCALVELVITTSLTERAAKGSGKTLEVAVV